MPFPDVERWYSKYLTVATVLAIPVALYTLVRGDYASGFLLLFIAVTGLALEWRGRVARRHANSLASRTDPKARRWKQALSVGAWVAWTAFCLVVLVYAVGRQVGD